MTYREEEDDQLVNEALLFGGLCALVVIAVALAAYHLLKP